MLLFKGQQLGKYKVLDSIGSGGFGSVYYAKDTMIGKPVAIKVPHRQGEDVNKLLEEPRLLAALNHPNIVTVITAEKTAELFYIVMEYVDGISLEQYLRKHRCLPVSQALQWFIQITEALDYAHARKVIHRDIRPANVLVARDGRLKVTDFGTSRFLHDNPFASTKIGSPPYMAPEHFRGRATFQSDIYSTGVLMYECLTGRLPHFDPNPQKMAQLATEGKVTAPHHHNPSITLELSQITLKAMHPNLNHRYSQVVDLNMDLKHLAKQSHSASSQDLAHLLDREPTQPNRSAKARPSKQMEHGRLFCWNCGRPISRRADDCPHCHVKQQ